MTYSTPGILLLYWFPLDGFAPSMKEHIDSFETYSAFDVFAWNTAWGFPTGLKRYRFDVVVLHYSLFGGPIYWIDQTWEEYISIMQDTLKIAFFQDEYRFWGLRYRLIQRLPIDVVYSCFEPRYHDATYYKHGWKGTVIHTLTGYVGDHLKKMAAAHAKPVENRAWDVGYRARELEAYMGRGAMEKRFIGDEFSRRVTDRRIRINIDTSEEGRIYGEEWYAFVGNCRAVLGVEAGVSIVDTEDILWPAWRRLMDEDREVSFETVRARLNLGRYENNIPLRTISPRHFEAAALGTVQVLFPGRYSGVLVPWQHYIPLEKDFSNVDYVLKNLTKKNVIGELAGNAYNEIIDVPNYSYRSFIATFDQQIIDRGIRPVETKTLNEGIRLEISLAYKAAMGMISKGVPWIGPHLFKSPHWPENLYHLRDKTIDNILNSEPGFSAGHPFAQ